MLVNINASFLLSFLLFPLVFDVLLSTLSASRGSFWQPRTRSPHAPSHFLLSQKHIFYKLHCWQGKLFLQGLCVLACMICNPAPPRLMDTQLSAVIAPILLALYAVHIYSFSAFHTHISTNSTIYWLYMQRARQAWWWRWRRRDWLQILSSYDAFKLGLKDWGPIPHLGPGMPYLISNTAAVLAGVHCSVHGTRWMYVVPDASRMPVSAKPIWPINVLIVFGDISRSWSAASTYLPESSHISILLAEARCQSGEARSNGPRLRKALILLVLDSVWAPAWSAELWFSRSDIRERGGRRLQTPYSWSKKQTRVWFLWHWWADIRWWIVAALFEKLNLMCKILKQPPLHSYYTIWHFSVGKARASRYQLIVDISPGFYPTGKYPNFDYSSDSGEYRPSLSAQNSLNILFWPPISD